MGQGGAVSCLLALLACGCAGPRSSTIQTFRSSPAGWTDLDGKTAQLDVALGHLDLPPDTAVHDPALLADFSAMADIALLGGDARGFGGIFVFDPAAAPRSYTCLAIRPGGEWRAYRGSSPLEPVGGRGWKALSRSSPAGFYRLGARAGGRDLQLLVDGKEVERVAIPGGGAGRLHAGIFGRGVATRWKNFIAGSGDGFRPEDHESWGSAADGEALLGGASDEVKRFRASPSRMGIYAVAAWLDEARRALGGSPGADGGAAAEMAADAGASLRDAARRIGEGDLLERALAALRAPGESGRAAAGSGALDRASMKRLEALRRESRPLRLDLSVDQGGGQALARASDLSAVVRESYGGLERARGGELRIQVRVERSAKDSEVSKAERKVAVARGGGGRLLELEGKARSLEKAISEALLDARARAGVIRGAAASLGPSTLTVLRQFEIDGKTYELHLDDGQSLERSRRALSSTRAEIEKEERNRSVEYRNLPARLHSTSILLELSYILELDGKPLIREGAERTYLGIEQWSHPADPALGVAEEKPDEAEVNEAVQAVHDRALRRFRTAISPESLVGKLPPGERLAFLLRLARATGEDADAASFQWALGRELKLEGAVLERTARALLGE